MTTTGWLAAGVAGLALATLPFWRFLPLGGSHAPHADHEPRHGGQLGMVGEHHLEVVRHNRRVEIFVSDAQRRAVIPVDGTVVFDRRDERRLEWRNHRLTAADGDGDEVEARVRLADGTKLRMAFDFDPSDPP